ncbi:hypothetical protein F5Y17DRAFT_463331 [Xylariaceae sp. FL0594]|nr:hypothetical protein F5Y17DRAFT_463331 [Xylariaceae sp. FL0594]
MADTLKLQSRQILRVGKILKGQDRINFMAVNREITKDMTLHCFSTTFRNTPYDEDLPPVHHAIKTGATRGWKWFRFHESGVEELLLAAAHNLDSLKYLAQLYPLRPAFDGTVIEREIVEDMYLPYYHYVPIQRNGSWIMTKNQRMVDTALIQDVLRRLYLSTADMFAFVLDHSAQFPPIILHILAALKRIEDPKIFDVAVQRGRDVDGLPENCRNSFLNQAYTPLLAACYATQPVAVEALLRLGANPNGIMEPWLRDREEPREGGCTGLDFYTPNPLLALLFSQQPWEWATVPPDMPRCGMSSCAGYGRGLGMKSANETLAKYRADEGSWPFATRRAEIVQSLLSDLQTADVRPWSDLCERLVEYNPEWEEVAGGAKGRDLMLKLFTHHELDVVRMKPVPPVQI